MIGSHPGGPALTDRLLSMAGGGPPALVLDLGAGDGAAVQYLQKMGYTAEGIDLSPSGEAVKYGDMRSLEYPPETFDLCLAECSLSVCGNGETALREACRVLKPSGSLLLSDVFFHREDLAPSMSMGIPLTLACWMRAFAETGLIIRKLTDETPVWKQFFLESLWNDNADGELFEFYPTAGKAKCGYFLAWLQKGETNGFI